MIHISERGQTTIALTQTNTKCPSRTCVLSTTTAVRDKAVLDAVGRGWLPLLMIAVSTSDATQTSICGYPTVAHGSSKLRDCTSPSFSKTAALWEKSTSAMREATTYLEESQLRHDSQDFCSISLGSNPTSDRTVMANEQTRKPCLTHDSP